MTARRRSSDDPPAVASSLETIVAAPAAVVGSRNRGPAVRLSHWPNDPTVGQFVVVDHQVIPTADEIASALDQARTSGYCTVRTSALFPQAADVVLAAGFRPVDTLALLTRRIGSSSTRGRRGPSPHRVGRLPRRRDGEAATLDQLAFGPTWGNDRDGIRAIRGATPWHRARCTGHGTLTGFVIIGTGGLTGYVQRLAVHPDHRRRGIADALVRDALTLLERRGVADVLVNTGTTNTAALALYSELGFVRLPDQLVVAEMSLDSDTTTGTSLPPRP